MSARPSFISQADLTRAVQQLQGQFVLYTQVESPTSHLFLLLLGSTATTTQPAETSALDVHCAWRTVAAGHIRCTWQAAIEGDTGPALRTLVGQQVSAVTLSEFGDLQLVFSSGHALHLWNDAPYEEGDSWLLSLPGRGEYAVATPNDFCHQPENRHLGIRALLAARQ